MKQFIAAVMVTLLASTSVFAGDVATSRDKTKKGVIIGNNRGSGSAKKGVVVGTVVGGAAGAIIGAMMDKQERELRQIEGVDVTRVDDGELKVTVKNDVLFDFNSSSLRSSSRDSLREMADVFEKYRDTTIVVAGHTDSVGSAAYNERLSERRASNVASYLENLGVRSSRIDSVGYGESKPRSSNNSGSGRQQNRRVELRVRAQA